MKPLILQDNVASNGLRLTCMNTGNLVGYEGGWGAGTYQNCPADHRICGFQVRSLGHQGYNNDDVGISEMKFRCCSITKSKLTHMSNHADSNWGLFLQPVSLPTCLSILEAPRQLLRKNIRKKLSWGRNKEQLYFGIGLIYMSEGLMCDIQEYCVLMLLCVLIAYRSYHYAIHHPSSRLEWYFWRCSLYKTGSLCEWYFRRWYYAMLRIKGLHCSLKDLWQYIFTRL